MPVWRPAVYPEVLVAGAFKLLLLAGGGGLPARDALLVGAEDGRGDFFCTSP
jgi:hypothetical protein